MAEVKPDRPANRAWHLVVTLPAGLFILLHLLARVAPPALWGADGLLYYGPLVTAVFIALPLATMMTGNQSPTVMVNLWPLVTLVGMILLCILPMV